MHGLTLPPAAKILVIEVAGLGDNVHLLPALWLVRQAWPDASLHVCAAQGTAALFQLAPWVDRVWEYPWNPRPGLRAHLAFGGALRHERYDLVINFSGSDRTTLLARQTGAPERWGRRPHDGGMRGFDWFYTRVLEHPFYAVPMFRQKWQCLRDAGLPGGAEPEFHLAIPAALRRGAGIEPADEGRYLHVSPFTTADRRELPLEQMADLIARLRREFPQHRLAISCAPTGRERDKLGALLARLDAPPWKVFAGTLDIPALAAVIERAALNLCGDTGSLHLALAVGTPAVAWFRRHAHDAQREWTPPGPRYRVLVSDQGSDTALAGIDNAALVGAAGELLRHGEAG